MYSHVCMCVYNTHIHSHVNCTCVPTCVPCIAIACMAIPCVFYTYGTWYHTWLFHSWLYMHGTQHNKLYETCMFQVTRKCGPHKHVTGLFKVSSCCHACKNEVVIERYHTYVLYVCMCVCMYVRLHVHVCGTHTI